MRHGTLDRFGRPRAHSPPGCCPAPQDRLSLWSQADTVAFGDSPEPILVEIDLACRLRDCICRSLEQRVADFGVVMPGMVGNAISASWMTRQCGRPSLRHVVGQSAMCDFCGRPKAGETGPGKPDQFQVSLDDEANVRLPLQQIRSMSVCPGVRRNVSANAPLISFAA